MSNRKDLLDFLKSHEPNISIEGTEKRLMWLDFDDDSIFSNPDAVIDVESPELFQFLALYLNQFCCAFKYKGTAVGRCSNADMYWMEHSFNKSLSYTVSMVEFPNDLEMVDFIIMLNDGQLPVKLPDDSPIIPFTFLTIGYRGDRFDAEAFVPCWDAPKPTWDEFAKELVSMAWQNEDGRIPLETVQEAFDEEQRIIKDWFDEYFKEENMTELEEREWGAGESVSDPYATGE